ncbi:MAG: hypothetical protein QHH19_06680 [Candidatus Thermoplasmatota archaeon]|jgi:hypothetical protein|nr:hypothetical protein [Candidatus Thermoplasmatota archaeon]
MGKEKLIPIIAIILLLIGITSSIYVYATNASVSSYITEKSIIVNNQRFTIEQIFSDFKIHNIATPDGGNFSGVALDELITETGIDCPLCHNYKIIGADNYEKTVTWENMQHGVLTEDGTVAFSDLTKAFRVKYVIKIEVI